MPVFLFLLLLVAAYFAYRYLNRRQRVNDLLRSELTPHERQLVAELVPLTQRLPTRFHRVLEGKMMRFFDQVEFIGCDGLEITEEMELSIAAQACLLIVNSDVWYKNLCTILVYPGAFKSMQRESLGYVVRERETVRLGESWHLGPVVLSWAHSLQGGVNDRDGRNVVFHEFAHQLDNLSGHTDGAPVLAEGQSFAEWAGAIGTAFENHVEAVATGRATFVDAYGAEGPEEFFAEVVELFFEKPDGLKEELPDVYEQLLKLLQLDPAGWER